MTETFDVRTPFKAGPAFGFPSELTESVTMFLFCSCTTLEIQSIVNLSMFYSGTPVVQEGRKTLQSYEEDFKLATFFCHFYSLFFRRSCELRKEDLRPRKRVQR